MNSLGAIQTLADYALKSAAGEDLAIYDSVALVAALMAPGTRGGVREEIETFARKASAAARAIREADRQQMEFRELLNLGGAAK